MLRTRRPAEIEADLAGLTAGAAHLLSATAPDYDELLTALSDARLVLLGEASHGTHEFYRERARLTRLPEQFDALLHIDETRAVEPLERSAQWERDEVPETFPTGL